MTEETAVRLGATPDAHGTTFVVWAPYADRVDVVIEPALGSRLEVALARDTADSLQSVPPNQTWTATVAGIGPGARYWFRVDGGEPLADPASRFQPDGVLGASMVVDTQFTWTDHDWSGVTLDDLVLYELHIGTFTAEGTFDAAIEQLDRLAQLGVTAVEVMPVNAFPGQRNWGYDGVFWCATQASYGGPASFARFVDAAHARGLGVVLDVVYNHLGPEGNVLPQFGPYITDDYSTPWGGAINVAGRDSDGVRRHIINSATGWIREFHLDGLRLDAMHAIVDTTARPLIGELTAAVHDVGASAGRHVLVTVESSANDPRIVRDTSLGGSGCDAVWNDDVHHALRVAITGEQHEYYAGYRGVADLAEAWKQRFAYHGQYSPVFGRRHGADASDIDHRRFVVFTQNHDHVGNTARGDRFLHAAPPDDPRRLLAASMVLLSPFTPMLFMGEEYAESAPFPYFVDHGDADLVDRVRQGRQEEFSGLDWRGDIADPAAPATFADAVLDPNRAESPPHRTIADFYRDLLALRRQHRVFTAPSAHQEVGLDGNLFTIVRRTDDARATLMFNFGPTTAAINTDITSPGTVVVDTANGDGDMTRPIGPWGARVVVATANPTTT